MLNTFIKKEVNCLLTVWGIFLKERSKFFNSKQRHKDEDQAAGVLHLNKKKLL